MIEKTYQPSQVEPHIYDLWEISHAFRAGRSERRHAQPYCIVIPPPNVTGTLHMGHALNNTLQDILCRFERMRGRDVLWQPGTDHAGIATQMVVERQLMERQEHRRSMTRAEFVRRVWEWKEKSGGAITHQLKRLGASCDWSRERFTLGERGDPNEQMVRAVVKAFVDLYEDDLIYKDKRLVNWDPTLRTAISDLEVQQIEVKGSFRWSRETDLPLDSAALHRVLDRNPNGHLYYFDYPLLGRTSRAVITVATTRPETMLGDMAVAVHPEDRRYEGYVGEEVLLPIVERPIPIIVDEYSDPEKGTGAVKITPAHDFNDFEVWRRYSARISEGALRRFKEVNNREIDDIISVLTPDARIKSSAEDDLDPSKRADWLTHLGPIPQRQSTPRSAANLIFRGLSVSDTIPERLRGLDRFEARKLVIDLMHAKGLLAKIEPHVHVVPHADRSGAVVEPFLTDQWYVNAAKLSIAAMDAVESGHTKFVPVNWERTFFDWMENIHPWCISRQLWWGHQIPAWYGPDGEHFVAENEEFATKAAAEHYEKGDTIQVGMWPLFGHAYASALRTGQAKLKREEDVLDTWFSSALWPFSTLGWPDATRELRRYYPTNTLVTGFDIIFFWVARMMMMGLRFMEEAPFDTVYIHALVRDQRGVKMSKSRGNVIDPLQLIDRYGADALRFTLAAMAVQGRDIKLSEDRVRGYRNFVTKLWNAARFAEMNRCVQVRHFDPRCAKETLNRWITHEIARTSRDVTQAIAEYKFNEAAGAIYRFTWDIFCDWYLELSKSILNGRDPGAKDETRAMTEWVLHETLKLLHPFMPFVTEELWGVIADRNSREYPILALAQWPRYDHFDHPAAEEEIGWIVDLVKKVRSVRTEYRVPSAATPSLSILVSPSEASTELSRWDDIVGRWRAAIMRLARLSTVDLIAQPGGVSSQFNFVIRGRPVVLYLEGIVDLAAERIRLSRELENCEAEIARFDRKLENSDFLTRAPEEIIEGEREKREAAEERKRRIVETLDRVIQVS
jgi:valyl-tRNA synthetase